ncbi:hypothetical protein PR048_000869 [Dryococelus australis]|uniref:Uncharacterized protein n=1 Tax=Dryococelus australis TaxID=614101 RepID=A0ABQ9IFS7_9NEOP|nr:hypothetical protein PR048_000869 [Dryococelus australis]
MSFTNDFCFNQRHQGEGDSLNHFLMDCRRLVKNCYYEKAEPQEEKMLVIVVVQGIRDNSVREDILRMDNTYFEKVAEYGRGVELSKARAQKFEDKTRVVQEAGASVVDSVEDLFS